MSDDDPFEIAEIALTDGGRLGIARLPGRTGNLAEDVEAIARWGANVVVSMTETSEMATHGAEGLSHELARRGIAHHAFPVPDYGVPADRDTRWSPLSESLRENLKQGGAVLLHCLGGKGRSGMVAARLMAEQGVKPADALARVRAARSGAVETDAQAAWAASGCKDGDET
ncbi:MAG: protein phosphatase [Methylobacterium sp.]|nr:MAG: protein phosphatase [Methylobacterium sp.]